MPDCHVCQIHEISRTIKENPEDETLLSLYIVTSAVGKYGSKRHGVRVEKRKIIFG
jgi:hypothetical protein